MAVHHLAFWILVVCHYTRSQQDIPVHGGYSQWSYWGWCSRSCGGGTQHRYRSCTNPPPANGGQDCSGVGRDTESRRCNTYKCLVASTKSCRNIASDQRCTFWESYCKISSYLQHNCAKSCGKCQVDGRYSDWSSWSECSVTCGNGTQQRHRSCTNPPPANNGTPCRGHVQEIRVCTSKMCLTPTPYTETCQNIASDEMCTSWKSYCKISRYLQRNCVKTCGICQVCKNSADDSYCKKWSNYCSSGNPVFSQYCKKTCGLCRA